MFYADTLGLPKLKVTLFSSSFLLLWLGDSRVPTTAHLQCYDHNSFTPFLLNIPNCMSLATRAHKSLNFQAGLEKMGMPVSSLLAACVAANMTLAAYWEKNGASIRKNPQPIGTIKASL
jgi:hypothetical protein